jgi:hypothetical protein
MPARRSRARVPPDVAACRRLPLRAEISGRRVKVGQLGDNVKIAREGAGQLSVTSSIPFSKRYLKYLTKKFLKKNQMREWLRVVATDKSIYALKFYSVRLRTRISNSKMSY